MGNYFTSETNNQNNESYLNNLRRWEREIKVNNLKKNYQTNNGPNYIKKLESWSNKIKIDNFIRNNDTNNPPDSIRELRLRNNYLEKELGKMNSNFSGLSIV